VPISLPVWPIDARFRNAGESGICQTVIDSGNVCAVMMEVVRHCSLGRIFNALHLVGGQYRRNVQVYAKRYPLADMVEAVSPLMLPSPWA